MKIKLLCLAAALSLLLMPVAVQADQKTGYPSPFELPVAKGLTFVKYEEAIKLAAEENKLVMLFFWAETCTWCTKIRQDVFENDKVREPFEKSFVAVSVDIARDPEKISEQFKPKALPTMAFMRPDGEVLGLLPGYVDLKTFVEIIDFIGTEALKTPAEK